MDTLIAKLMDDVSSAPDADTQQDRFRAGFAGLRSTLPLHPDSALRASTTFEQAASLARGVAVDCLPLALALVMHLYPLCALQCVPLPVWSRARQRRTRLVREIHRSNLILANAGSERALGANSPLTARRSAGGILVDGAFEYVSLASVADLVLFEAPLVDGSGITFCAAQVRAASVRIGAPRFSGAMRLSDTRPLSFVRHLVPHGQCFVVPADSSGPGCIRDYQRCWFHLLLAEINLARIDRLRRLHDLALPAEHLVVSEECGCLREYCLHLLDAPFVAGNLKTLSRVSATLKLRVSQLAQATAAQLRTLAPANGTDAEELLYMRMQPTADAKILRQFVELERPHDAVMSKAIFATA